MTFQKQGQVIIFLIVAAVLVLSLLVIVLVERPTTEASVDFISGLSGLELAANSCLQEATKESLSLLGTQGGYLNIPDPYVVSLEDDTLLHLPYYFYEDTIQIPTKAVMEQELSEAINVLFSLCLSELEGITEQGILLEQGTGEIKVTLTKSEAIVESSFPLSLSREGVRRTIPKVQTKLFTPFWRAVIISKEFIDLQANNPGGVALSDMVDIGEKYDVTFEYDQRDDSVAYFLYVPDKDEPFVFGFAVKYDFSEDFIGMT